MGSKIREMVRSDAGPACLLCTADRYVHKHNSLASPHVLIASGAAWGWMLRGVLVQKNRDINVNPDELLTFLCPNHRGRFNDLAEIAAGMTTGIVPERSGSGRD